MRRHGPMVLGVCRRILANDHDADDAFQATFLVLARKAAAVVPRGVVGNWLYGVAANVARKARAMSTRRQSRERLTDAGLKELAAIQGLQTLDISQTSVTDEGLKALAAFKSLRGAERVGRLEEPSDSDTQGIKSCQTPSAEGHPLLPVAGIALVFVGLLLFLPGLPVSNTRTRQ